mmetsp:Transcript_6047/g.15022  ORF Transcript_6047/g.15022 Transcript_6047/m.15022 type:complete len:80 (-) Transcript_6047:10-249(-)
MYTTYYKHKHIHPQQTHIYIPLTQNYCTMEEQEIFICTAQQSLLVECEWKDLIQPQVSTKRTNEQTNERTNAAMALMSE